MTGAPQEFAVCMGMDAMRLCLGQKPRNFSVEEVIRWLGLMNASAATLPRKIAGRTRPRT